MSHPQCAEVRVLPEDLDEVDEEFCQLEFSARKVLDSLTPTETVTSDWRSWSPLSPDPTPLDELTSKPAGQRSSFDAKLSDHHGPPLGPTLPLAVIDTEAEPLPLGKWQSKDEKPSRHGHQDFKAGSSSELTWAVQTSDDFAQRQRQDSIDSFMSDNSALNARMARHLSGCDVELLSMSSDLSSDGSLYSVESDHIAGTNLESDPVWTRPWKSQEGVVPGTWLCPHCEQGLNVNESRQTAAMREDYKKLQIQPPFERLPSWGILQRKCGLCNKKAFCKLFQHGKKQEQGGDSMAD
ncbi:hypothetical protein J3459_002510 [Metarhizium acridum]|uniref:Uncharacterized protein n=1 Tax=Metarhizium acridum (strain CQMa 102) TaxID=655827 RepID=E9E8V4_METAQ|nr:uncharacterized protein MAC_06302 [Metarhizium acridum CQMa 102]EFY87590.1 hypothetical protein MAC_06302 [Metarhizium acridum CQMa 102]KAG8424331.1 hypothetical protein J3458_001133 [Metarhizium acridum]KAG8428711.1 hypothetical protein J3459_002510 [Metarhizium acridum]